MSSSRSKRRSARDRHTGDNDVIAPGHGTANDINRLTRDLDGNLPNTAVLAMMKCEGNGIASNSDSTTPFASPKTSSAWSDFMAEAGPELDSNSAENDAGDVADAANKSNAPPNKKLKMEEGLKVETSSSSDGQTGYNLSVLSAGKMEEKASFGSLVQSGTMDSTFVGRKNLKATDNAVYHLAFPTVLMPLVAITKVCASCNGAHAIAIDKSNQAWGWGRNEGLVLGSSMGEDAKVIPTPKVIATDILTAALGKSHTLFLKSDGTIHALGQNKVGQCGWRGNVKQSGVLKPSLALVSKKEDGTNPVFRKIACGEDFSVALSDEGILYTTGSAEFGQLANGETGEHFVKANKLAFNDSYGFREQTIFHDNDPNDDNPSDLNRKTIVISTPIRIQDIAVGKHHALALEAPTYTGGGTRIFSWGCGNYGVLGHNRQKDEYYPRRVSSLQQGMTFTKLAAGSNCSLALSTQGHVYYWGNHRSNSEAVMKPKIVDALANNQHIVKHIAAGPTSIVCSTDLGNTVAWGNGPYGELGIEGKKSSSKPAFVDSISGLVVSDLACGQGSVLYVIKDDKKLPKADIDAIEAALK